MNYTEMSLVELKKIAKELGIKGVSSMKKNELAELLTAVKERQQEGKKQAASTKNEKTEIKDKAEKKDKQQNNKSIKRNKTNTKKDEKQEPDNQRKNSDNNSSNNPKNDSDNNSQKNPKSDSDNNSQQNPKSDSDNLNNNSQDNVRNNSQNNESRTISEPQNDSSKVKPNESPLDSGQEANGILEVMSEGYGFIRCENYLPGDDDIYVSPAQIKRFNLKTGDIVIGNKKVKTEREKFAALLYIKSVNGYSIDEAVKRKNFEDLTPIFPDERIKLENEHSHTISMRIMDLLAPIGKGQRGMIVAPPKAGKTTLLKQIAVSISRQYKDMHLIVLLIDERPEEVTDIRETIEGPNVEVIYSTFDELPEHHKRVAEMVLERAKRLVEHREDVVILLDSITRLARAYNLTVPPSGRTLTGGLDPAALHMPKKFFGAARNMREGGSLTVLATALVDTGSKMDDVVFEEFKGTGNMELVLDRKLSERRIFPAIDIAKSGTRRDDLLLTPVEKEMVNAMTREFSSNRGEEKVEEILKLFLRTRDNREFLELIKRSLYRR